jgi:hypothetical protein
MIRRLRMICNGSAIVEDVEEYGRVSQMFANLLPSSRRYNDIRESWGATTDAASLSQPFVAEPIPAGASRTLVVHLLSSVLSQGKAIPLSLLPLVCELEIGDMNVAFAGEANNWVISRPRLIADVISLDASLQNSYSKFVLQGSSIPYIMHGMYSLKATITDNTQFSLPINRGFSRLSTVYWSFIGPDAAGKEVNTFLHPLNVRTDPADPGSPLVPVTTATDLFSWNITVGSDRYPQFDCDSVGESFHRLRMAQLVHQGSDSFSISSAQYRSDKGIFACSFEKAPGQASHSGINTRSGSQVCLNFKNVGAARQIHVVLHFEVALTLSSAGCEVLD